MLLVIDSGNTNVVFALHDGEHWCGQWRISANDSRTADEYAVWFYGLLDRVGLNAADVARAIIGTVVPAALYDLRRFCRKWLKVEPLVAHSRLDWGIEVLVDNPDELGADRRLNALAAKRFFGGPSVVVDFGTATTFDVINEQGQYCGGAIAPGVNLSSEALHRAAARLPRMSIGRPIAVIGRNTSIAMRSGLFWGYVGLVEGIIRRIADEMGARPKVVATGGLAPLFSEGTDLFDVMAPDLTLDGLRLLADRNATVEHEHSSGRIEK